MLHPIYARVSAAMPMACTVEVRKQTSIGCMCCFPNEGHVIILGRTVYFKFCLIHVHIHV